MTPSDHHLSLVRLLAEFDQRAAAAEDMAYRPTLTTELREAAVALWKFQRNAGEQLERMLDAKQPANES
jgi:hypothetical protein